MSTRYVLQAGAWLIFLTLFITDVSKSDHSAVIKTTSYALTVLFIAVYLLSMMMLGIPHGGYALMLWPGWWYCSLSPSR